MRQLLHESSVDESISVNNKRIVLGAGGGLFQQSSAFLLSFSTKKAHK
jgi:hypothetical protein